MLALEKDLYVWESKMVLQMARVGGGGAKKGRKWRIDGSFVPSFLIKIK
jgi:hypothetical protein